MSRCRFKAPSRGYLPETVLISLPPPRNPLDCGHPGMLMHCWLGDLAILHTEPLLALLGYLAQAA
eukprot:8660875-Alexandrium_andersonii.AAC.1